MTPVQMVEPVTREPWASAEACMTAASVSLVARIWQVAGMLMMSPCSLWFALSFVFSCVLAEMQSRVWFCGWISTKGDDMPIIPNMKVEHVHVSDIVPYANNAKTHLEYQVNQIVESINSFGFNDPIAIDENNVIIEGHGRVYAAQRLGMSDVHVIRLEHLDDEAKRAYILVHNKLTMNSDFDANILALALSEIFDYDMSDFGFASDTVDIDGFGTDFELADGDAPSVKSMTLHMTKDEHELFKRDLDGLDPGECRLDGGNKTGNKVCEVLQQWAERETCSSE